MHYLYPFGSTQPENIEIIDLGGNNGPLLFCYDQEPLIPVYNYPLFIKAKYTRDDSGNQRPVILLNTERRSQAKKEIFEKWDFQDCYYFFHVLAAADWYRGYQYCAKLTPPNQRTIQKKYITFNRITGNSRVYRSFFIAELQRLGLLEQGHVSYSEQCPVHNTHYRENMLSSVNEHQLSFEYVAGSISALDQISFPLRIDYKTRPAIPNGSQSLSAIDECMESFLHVVTETCFWEDKEHLTEKIFKPIVARQPFVLLGCANNLKYLKDYGFRTFDSWWDESYDAIEDPIQRLQAVVKIIQKISSLTTHELEDLLKDMSSVLEHNYRRFYSQDLLDQVWNELDTNLQTAVARLSRPMSQEM